MRTALVTILAAGLMAAPAAAQQTVQETKAARADGVVEIENVAGSVRVEGWNRNEVALDARLGRGIEGVDFDVSGGQTRIEVNYPRRGNSGGADLVVRVPAGSRVKTGTVSADITVTGVSGPLDLRSVSGEVEVGGAPRSVSVETVSGDIQIGAGSNDVRTASVSGDIQVGGARGVLQAETTSGEIQVRGSGVSSLNLHTVSGSIGFTGSLDANASANVEAFSGEVDFLVPADTRGDFELSTFSGSIRNDFNNQAVQRERRGPGASLEFTTGARGAQIKLKSFSGSLRLGRT